MNLRIAQLLLFFMACTVSLLAQSSDSAQREAMKKLRWWVGEWRGEAWTSTGPGRRDTTTMVETIRMELDGTIIIVEGLGQKKMQQMQHGETAHHAFAVISYDDKKASYRWHSWRVPGGLYNETEPIVSDQSFRWSMETPRGKIRYTATLNAKGQWEEKGEFSVDGQTWRPFFGMLLNRVE